MRAQQTDATGPTDSKRTERCHSVLIVDDDDDIRESLSDLFLNAGYETLCAEDGKEALLLLRSASRRVDVILLDIMMPVMDGELFRWEQLADATLAHIPVIVLSATNHCAETASRLRAVGCLAKPFEIERLLELVKRACGPH